MGAEGEGEGHDRGRSADEERADEPPKSCGLAAFRPMGIAGVLADPIGATTTLLASGVICVLAALGMTRQLPLLRRHLRPIYARLGIEP